MILSEKLNIRLSQTDKHLLLTEKQLRKNFRNRNEDLL
jgi:hypothetical protein